MADSRRRQPGRLLASWYIATAIFSSMYMVRANEFPTTVDVDIIYPRNGTFAPTLITPIVFAVRNMKQAKPLNLRLSWDIYGDKHPVRDGLYSTGSADLTWVDYSNVSDIYYEYSWTAMLNLEDSWWIRWEISWGNCSRIPEKRLGEDMATDGDFHYANRVVEFTTKNGAKELDLAEVNKPGDDTCGNTTDTRATFNIVDVLNSKNIPNYHGGDTCAVLAPPSNATSLAPTRTCGTEVGASAASSISAAITSQICNRYPRPEVSCPPEEPSSATRAIPFLVGTIWINIFVLASGVYMFLDRS
ncbi:hypothetical protein F5Y11DRAFT_282865 [Daldinia sp. FL1419]|nr:hypothetical protein F5Y11DRAFT_282865 [Daldinia sp. FL1419]